MFTNQELDISLNIPCRRLSSVAAPPPSSKNSNHASSILNNGGIESSYDGAGGSTADVCTSGVSDDGMDVNAWEEEDEDDYLKSASNQELNVSSSDVSDYNLDIDGGGGGALSCHRFLVGSSFPSVCKLEDDEIKNDYSDEQVSDDNSNAAPKMPILKLLQEEDEYRINRLHMLVYHEDSHEFLQESSWIHPTGEVWSMTCHPRKWDWVATCGGGAVFGDFSEGSNESGESVVPNHVLAKFQTTVWRLPNMPSSTDSSNLDDDDIAENMWSSDNPSSSNVDEISRKRTESSASALSSANKMEPLVIVPHASSFSSLSSSSFNTMGGWEQRVGCILWNPSLYPGIGGMGSDEPDATSPSYGGNLVTVGWDATSPVALWDISTSNVAKEVWTTGFSNIISTRPKRRFHKLTNLQSSLPRRASWNPHDINQILVTSGVNITAYDVRQKPPKSNTGVGFINCAHRYGITDISHNQSQPHVVVTAGVDGVVKFWDLRVHLSSLGCPSFSEESVTECVEGVGADSGAYKEKEQPSLLKAIRGGHTHWITRAAYNPFYDQLVLSGSSDGIANLLRISSCSSAPLLELDGEEGIDDGDEEEDDGAEEITDEVCNLGVNGSTEEKESENFWYNQQVNEDEKNEKDESNVSDSDKEPLNISRNESTAPDIRVTRYECSDATSDVAWSVTDPWIYATLSCDGAVVLHHVPSKEKYKILL